MKVRIYKLKGFLEDNYEPYTAYETDINYSPMVGEYFVIKSTSSQSEYNFGLVQKSFNNEFSAIRQNNTSEIEETLENGYYRWEIIDPNILNDKVNHQLKSRFKFSPFYTGLWLTKLTSLRDVNNFSVFSVIAISTILVLLLSSPFSYLFPSFGTLSYIIIWCLLCVFGQIAFILYLYYQLRDNPDEQNISDEYFYLHHILNFDNLSKSAKKQFKKIIRMRQSSNRDLIDASNKLRRFRNENIIKDIKIEELIAKNYIIGGGWSYAVDAITESIAYFPSKCHFYYLRSQAYNGLKQYDNQVQDLRMAIMLYQGIDQNKTYGEGEFQKYNVELEKAIYWDNYIKEGGK